MPDSLPPDLKALIRAKVESGKYESEEHVLREALAVLENYETPVREHESIRCAAEIGLASQLEGDLDIEEIIDEIEKG